jgi:glucose-6-phosphate isomerase
MMNAKKLISFDFGNSLSSKIGDLGITEAEIAAASDLQKKALQQFKKWQDDETYGFFDLPEDDSPIDEICDVFDLLPEEIDTLLHIGIGGSSLGPITIQQALDNHLTPKLPIRFNSVVIQENIDPEGFAIRLHELDLTRTAINVVSKSGGTIETLANFIAAKEEIQRCLGSDDIGDRIIINTENLDGILAGISKELGTHLIKLPHNVGGRFSVLTAVGLLPAKAMGIDAHQMLAGASAMREAIFSAKGSDDPAFLAAFLPYYFNKKGINIHVIFPYSELLGGFAKWCCQLLGESLGKATDRSGKKVNVGMTPTPSVGSVDQHSLLQLYMEGPADKFVTFFRVENFRCDFSMKYLPHSQLDKSHTENLQLGDILNAEQSSTGEALALEGRPSACVSLPELNPHTLGQLFYFMEIATAYGAELWNLDAFDQPGVEASKLLTVKKLRGE